MSHTTRFASPGGILLAICAALAGCSSRTNVSATGSAPPQYQHVFITAQEVWFNTSATATAEDSGWAKFPLTTPATVDLVTQSNGSLGEIINDLQLAPGSYAQIRLIPVDASAALTTSAQALGATFNAEADYVDGTVSRQLALELPNPDKGIGIQATLTVPVGKVGATTGKLGTSATTNSTTNPSTSLFGSTNTTTNNTTNTTANNTTTNNTTTNNTTTTGTSSSSSTNTKTTVSFAMRFDGSRDLATFTYGGAQGGVGAKNGVLLSAHPAAHDLASSGAISGTLTLTSLNTATITNASNRLNIVATAETLSADGTHHVVVASAPVTTSGTFTLYPLASNSSTPTTYDVVIHGPAIATMIIKSVPVTVTPPVITSSNTTGSSTATTTATTPVLLGTFIPRAAATSFSANVTPTASATLPAGATVSFYQTLPASGEVPYVIEEAALDPFNFTLGSAEPLSGAATIDSGTYTTSGATITLTSSTPTEGAGTYGVAASAPLFTDGSISSKVAPPAAGTTTAVRVTVPALTVASGASATSITASVAQATAGKYDQGQVIVTRDGAVIGTASLDSALTGRGTVTINGLPGGNSFSSALYDLSVRVWNSKDPAGTLRRQWYSSPVDLRSGSATGVALTVN
jgi:hypothetical protein